MRRSTNKFLVVSDIPFIEMQEKELIFGEKCFLPHSYIQRYTKSPSNRFNLTAETVAMQKQELKKTSTIYNPSEPR
jgi:hypothetical protein